MRLRLYIDEDAMSRAVVVGLRARGIDVATVVDDAKVGQDDRSQLTHATLQGRVLYTFNVGDFCRLHEEYATTGKTHSGIIVVYRQRYSAGEQLRRLLNLANTKSAEEMRNQLLFL